MAAVYLHNALYIRNPPAEPQDNLEHSRNLSTISNGTLHTSTTGHSHPTEPLLHPATNPITATAYYDQISRQPRNPDGTPARLRWDDPLSPEGTPVAAGEKGRYWRSGTRRPMRLWRRVAFILEVIMDQSIGAWAIYTTLRYFLAFKIHRASQGQTYCLALGTSSGVSFGLILCSLILSTLKKGAASKYLTPFRSYLLYFSSLCLLGPAAVSLALVFAWKTSPNVQLNVQSRCRLDIDTIWSISSRPCFEHPQPWSNWVVLASVRLVLTLAVILSYHAIHILCRRLPGRPTHRHFRTDSMPNVPSSSTMLMPPLTPHRHHAESVSDATLIGDTPPRPPSRMRLARSRSSGLSEATSGEPLTFGRSVLPNAMDLEGDRETAGFVDRFRSLLSQITRETEDGLELARSDGAPSPENNNNSRDREIMTPTDLPPSYTANPHDHESDDELDDSDDDDYVYESRTQTRNNENSNVFNLPPIPPTLGYNEFGLPYPPDENVRVLNGVIRRMPTIESMGSGEITSFGGSSYRPNGSQHTNSRPPTRNTLLSFTGTDYELPLSNPPSRANSLSVRAEYLAAMSSGVNNGNGGGGGTSSSEHGELLSRLGTEVQMRRFTQSPTGFTDQPSPGGAGASNSHETYSTSGSGSGSYCTTSTYHTAATGSGSVGGTGGSTDSYPPGLYPDGMGMPPPPHSSEPKRHSS